MPEAEQFQHFISLLDEYVGYLEDVPEKDTSEGYFQLEDQINAAAPTLGFAALFERVEEWHDAHERLAGGVEECVNAINASVDDGKIHPAEAEQQLREIEKQYHIALRLTAHFPNDRGRMWFPALPLDSGERKQLVSILLQWQRAARTASLTQDAMNDTSESEATAAVARPKTTKTEANIKARAYLQVNTNATARELAAGIACSTGLVSKLPAWQAVKEQRDNLRQPKKVAVVSLSAKLQRIAGNEDESLAKLIGEQEADAEPSPLQDDASSDRRGTPRTAKVYR